MRRRPDREFAARPFPLAGRLCAGLLSLGVAFAVASANASAESPDGTPGEGDPTAHAREGARDDGADPTAWSDWRSYRVSLIGGFGATFDHVDSSYTGAMRRVSGGSLGCLFPGDTAPNRNNCIRVSGEGGGFVVGGAFNLGGRVALPEFDLPSRPQLFLNASWALQRLGSQTLAHQGLETELWPTATDSLGGLTRDPFLYIAQTFDPEGLLFIGAGASFRLPIDRRRVRLNGTVSYYRSKAIIGTRYDFINNPTSSGPLGNPDLYVEDELIVHGIAPGFGIDVDIMSNSVFEVGFYTDFFVGFPLSNNASRATLTNGIPVPNPVPEEKVDFSFDRDVDYSLFLGIRLGLARD